MCGEALPLWARPRSCAASANRRVSRTPRPRPFAAPHALSHDQVSYLLSPLVLLMVVEAKILNVDLLERRGGLLDCEDYMLKRKKRFNE